MRRVEGASRRFPPPTRYMFAAITAPGLGSVQGRREIADASAVVTTSYRYSVLENGGFVNTKCARLGSLKG